MLSTIDLDGTRDPARARRVGELIAAACGARGAFQVIGHGVDAAVTEDVVRVSAEFFALAEEVKRRHSSSQGNPYLGWAPTDRPGPDGPRRVHEQFEVSRFDAPQELRDAGYTEDWVMLAEPNPWPAVPRDFETTWKRYLTAMEHLGQRLLGLMSSSLGLQRGGLTGMFSRSASYLACNHYPPMVDGPEVRLERHTDIGTLTILHRAGPGGLQLRGHDDTWQDVPVVEGAFVVTLGDVFTIWTNGQWSAPEHRVVAPPANCPAAQWSVAYFQHPNLDATIECLPSFHGPADPPRHRPRAAGAWTRERMQATASDGLWHHSCN